MCYVEGMAVVAYTKPQQMKKEESERLSGEGDQIKLIDLRFRKARRQGVPLMACSRDE